MRLHALVAAALAAAPFAVHAQTAAAPTMPPAAAPAAPALPASPQLTSKGDVVATLKASPDFSILSKALDDTQLSAVVAGTPGLTLFAPTNAAFKALPPAELSALLDPKNVSTLQKVLTYHLVHLSLDTAKFKGAKGPVQTVENGSVELDGSGPTPKVNDADIIQSDVRAPNGNLIQVVDKVLIPADVTLPVASAQAGSSTGDGR
ncbi:MAG: fasciclin domain-containing protein [Caulobacteraceae bacterium]|jgi:uncharacterized surface protein with fasciclin (FAS1) repeats